MRLKQANDEYELVLLIKYYCVALFKFLWEFNFADRRFFLVLRLLIFAIITESRFLVFSGSFFFFCHSRRVQYNIQFLCLVECGVLSK